MLVDVLLQYNIVNAKCTQFIQGLINHTYLVRSKQGKFVMQQINNKIFETPEAIHTNVTTINNYLRQHNHNNLLIEYLPNKLGQYHTYFGGFIFRLYKFVDNAVNFDVTPNLQIAFKAAACFATLTANTAGLNMATLSTTIPNFHNLPLRLSQYKAALQTGLPQRIAECATEIAALANFEWINEKVEQLKTQMQLRVTHHDAKLDNVLFDNNDIILALIDYDTLMPGYFISDLGDMMRTYLPNIKEDDENIAQLYLDKELYHAILNGYLSAMEPHLTPAEKQLTHSAGTYMIFMQATRFLTDYLNGDIYYKCTKEKHNLIRARNQIALLQAYDNLQ
jgi:Ser/Thr protein kinase RdoA (MazF antagonist)